MCEKSVSIYYLIKFAFLRFHAIHEEKIDPVHFQDLESRSQWKNSHKLVYEHNRDQTANNV